MKVLLGTPSVCSPSGTNLRAPTRRSGVMVHGMRSLYELEPYHAPEWALKLPKVPVERYALGVFPTPLHKWKLTGLPEGVEVWVKQDSLSGLELSGNKVRKLEFLFADALKQGHDCVVTLGGIQSNHARATAAAATALGLECHTILRNSRSLVDGDPGLVGNLLVERMVGAHVHQVTKEEYGAVGQVGLAQRLAEKLKGEGKNPYVIPVGGSNGLGTWGYLDAINEIIQQVGADFFTDIVSACGSGATSGGLALGVHLSGMKAAVYGYAVCDEPDYFYDVIDGLFHEMGATPECIGASARDMLHVIQAKGAGYAISQSEELQVVQDIARSTGILLDPVYTGKAMYGFMKDVAAQPEQWRGRRVLFIHTGGLYGMYDKLQQLQPLVEGMGLAHRMKV